MRFFGRFSPLVAYRDLRAFLLSRERYELGFLALAMAITGGVIVAFLRSAPAEAPYRREITYVRQFRADRTDGEIRAQQLIDETTKQEHLRAVAAEREKNRLEFKRLDDSLTNMGL